MLERIAVVATADTPPPVDTALYTQVVIPSTLHLSADYSEAWGSGNTEYPADRSKGGVSHMDRDRWSEHLAAIAAPALAGTPLDPESGPCDPDVAARFIDSFADELNHRRAVDRPLLGRLLGIAPTPPESEPASEDVALWWAIHTGVSSVLVERMMSSAPGPLIGEPAFQRGAIEATTETELGALHALAHHARAAGGKRSRISARCLDAARWHVDTLQPDNGTNHPWAIHVFIELADADPAYAMGATLHAEGLLHNAMVRTGRPDRFSACLLLDASRALGEPSLVITSGDQKK